MWAFYTFNVPYLVLLCGNELHFLVCGLNLGLRNRSARECKKTTAQQDLTCPSGLKLQQKPGKAVTVVKPEIWNQIISLCKPDSVFIFFQVVPLFVLPFCFSE